MTFLTVGKSFGLVVFFSFLKDFFYALIFHIISIEIQRQTPESKMAGVHSARFIQMAVILALGEYLVGSWTEFMTPINEASWRFTLATITAVMLANFSKLDKIFKRN